MVPFLFYYYIIKLVSLLLFSQSMRSFSEKVFTTLRDCIYRYGYYIFTCQYKIMESYIITIC